MELVENINLSDHSFGREAGSKFIVLSCAHARTHISHFPGMDESQNHDMSCLCVSTWAPRCVVLWHIGGMLVPRLTIPAAISKLLSLMMSHATISVE